MLFLEGAGGDEAVGEGESGVEIVFFFFEVV